MGNIPLVIAKQSALSNVPETRASPAAFGAQIGAAVMDLGAGVQQLGGALAQKQEQENARKRQEAVANAVATADFSGTELDIRKNAPADGTGVADATKTAYQNFVEAEANKIDDPIVRSAVRVRLLERLSGKVEDARSWEYTQAQTYGKEQADFSLQSLENRVRANAASYDQTIQDGFAVIQARPGLTAAVREQMQIAWGQRLVNARFGGLLSAAKTPDDFDQIEKQLTDEKAPWQGLMKPEQFDTMLDTIHTARKAFVTAADASARAALESLEERTNKLVLIDPNELKSAQDAVRASQNPITQERMARVLRSQDIIQREGKLPSYEINKRVDETNGVPTYPGVPPDVSGAINRAASTFNVPASYLGGTVVREYGGNFKMSPQVSTTLRGYRKGDDTNVDALDPNFGARLARALTDAEKATGVKPVINEGARSAEVQAQYRANYTQKPVIWNGKTYYPQKQGGLAAEPGKSRHQYGQAADIVEGPALDWLHQHATDYGLEFLPGQAGRDDPVHIQLAASAGGGYGAQASTSGAVGIFQFLPSTWLDMMHDGKTPQRFGFDPAGKSDADLLAYRADPTVSAYMAAAYAEKNVAALTPVLGRAPNDTELYMAHFLGTQGAVDFLRTYKDNPNMVAADLAPAAAKANKSVFYDKEGKPYSVGQVYDRVSTSFAAAPSRVGYGDTVTRQAILKQQQEGEKTDPVSLARTTGAFHVTDLSDPNGYTARGQEAKAIADYYHIAATDMKPFTQDEVAAINKQMKEGDADATLAIMAQIQNMGPQMARAAYKQLGENNAVFEHAAGLAYERGALPAASDIVRGQKRIDAPGNENVKQSVSGDNLNRINSAFNSALGAGQYTIEPRLAGALRNAAIAHYVETYVAKGKGDFNEQAFRQSINAVLGGTPQQPAIGDVNGHPTILPPGVSASTFDTALNRMTVDDWRSMSFDHTAPYYANGEVVPPRVLADQAAFMPIGGNMYKVMLPDGAFATSGLLDRSGRPAAYLFVADGDQMNEIAKRGDNTPSGAPGAPTRSSPPSGPPTRSSPRDPRPLTTGDAGSDVRTFADAGVEFVNDYAGGSGDKIIDVPEGQSEAVLKSYNGIYETKSIDDAAQLTRYLKTLGTLPFLTSDQNPTIKEWLKDVPDGYDVYRFKSPLGGRNNIMIAKSRTGA